MSNEQEFVNAFEQNDQEQLLKYSDKVCWKYISEYQKLSEKFIEKYSDKVDWDYISKYQKLSEKFIEKYSDKVCWGYISQYQKLSEKFIEKYSDKVYWDYISQYQKLSKEFITAHNLKIEDSNWLYKDNQYKLNFLKNIGLYEIVDNKYIIAYKSCRSDGYSAYNFQYKYEMGNEYTSHCDCTGAEDSFGLSAWTKEKAIQYCKEKLLKVKINIEDIGIVVHKGGKIRCRKLTVLSVE